MFQMPGQGPTSYLDAAQREKALQSMQQMSSAQIVSATSNMHSRMVAPPVSYGGFWQHPGLGGQTTTQDVKPFAQSPFLHGDKTPTSLGKFTGNRTVFSKKENNINVALNHSKKFWNAKITI
jgi:hypothetical protein